MSLGSAQALVFSIRVLLLSGHVGAPSAAFTRLPKGDWGQGHQVEDRGGWRHAPCLLQTPKTIHTTQKKQNKTKIQNSTKGTNKTSMHKQSPIKIQKLLLILLTAQQITSCQTIGATKNSKMSKVLQVQDTLIDAVMDERELTEVSTKLAGSEQFRNDEAHVWCRTTEYKTLEETSNGGNST